MPVPQTTALKQLLMLSQDKAHELMLLNQLITNGKKAMSKPVVSWLMSFKKFIQVACQAIKTL